jgi:hypothetical protein
MNGSNVKIMSLWDGVVLDEWICKNVKDRGAKKWNEIKLYE